METRPITDFKGECEEYQKELEAKLGDEYSVESVTIITNPRTYDHHYAAKVYKKRI